MPVVDLTELAPRYASMTQEGTVPGSRLPRGLTEEERTVLASRYLTPLADGLAASGWELSESEPLTVAYGIEDRPPGPGDARLVALVEAAEDELLAGADRLADFLGLVERRREHWLAVAAAAGRGAL